jgi:hypothetical protein
MNQPTNPAEQSAPATPITLAIYRDLRIGSGVTLAMLAVAVFIERGMATCWQGALSEYYYTSAHSIFIAALLGTATLFFVYRGSSDTEDALLTLAGVAAMIAALVPQVRPIVCGPYGVPKEFDVEALVRPNVWAVVVALVLGWSLTFWQQKRHPGGQQTRTLGGTLALYFLRLVVAVGLIGLIFFRPQFLHYAHGAAGVLMLSAFILTVFSTSYLAGKETDPPALPIFRRFYWIISRTMLVTLIGVLLLHRFHPDWIGNVWITVLEGSLILEFAAYWVVQSIDLWNTPDRSDRIPTAPRKRASEVPPEAQQPKGVVDRIKSQWAEAKAEQPGEKLLQVL